jgi:hypothetical protein
VSFNGNLPFDRKLDVLYRSTHNAAGHTGASAEVRTSRYRGTVNSETSGTPVEPQMRLLLNRVFQGQLDGLPVWFDRRVLDKYRQSPSFKVIRSNTVGRVTLQGSWSVDFGISPDERLIHLTAGDLGQKLPAAERNHWASHVVTLPLSRNYLTMRAGAGACIDDGDIRTWSVEESPT